MHSMLARLQQADSVVVAGGAAGAMLGLVAPDAFFSLFLILVGSNLADWLLGRHAARALNRYDRTKSRNGLVGKGSQMIVLLVLRSLEAVLPATGLPSTMGLASAALALALIIEDIESIERHGMTLGGGPIPGLSPILKKLRLLTGSERRTPSEREAGEAGGES